MASQGRHSVLESLKVLMLGEKGQGRTPSDREKKGGEPYKEGVGDRKHYGGDGGRQIETPELKSQGGRDWGYPEGGGRGHKRGGEESTNAFTNSGNAGRKRWP